MRIGIYSTSLPEPLSKPGGVDVAVHRLANALAVHPEDEVTVLSLSPPPKDALYQHRLLWGGTRVLRERELWRLGLLPFLLNAVDTTGFDVVHLHGDDWFWVRRACPSVRTFHGLAIEEARSATSYKRRIAQFGVHLLEKLSARLATRILAVGMQTQRVHTAAVLVDNGVDLDVFHPGPKRTEPTVLFLGTWDGRKRGQFVYKYFLEDVLPVVPEARLVMACPTCPPHPRVVHAPRPSDDDLAALYREAWVFALPSKYEGFGIPYVEAMASGTVVLATPNDGAKYILGNGRYGVLVRDELFGAELVRVLRDQGRRRAYESVGLKRAQSFTWEAVAAAHRRVYMSCIEGEVTAVDDVVKERGWN